MPELTENGCHLDKFLVQVKHSVPHPFGARVTIGLSKGMNNPEREANALGNSKTQLKSIAGLFLCPANYHPELMPGLRSMSSAILLVVRSGKRIVSKNYFCVDLRRFFTYGILALRELWKSFAKPREG